MPDGQPLVILMGEPHSMPAHIELQHMVASKLAEAGEEFTVNLETPHNALGLYTHYSMKKDIPSDLYYNTSDYDKYGQVALSSSLAYSGFQSAPVSSNSFLAFLHDQKIPTVFNDAAYKAGALDLEDAYTKNLVEKFQDNGAGLDVSDTNNVNEKIAVRNLSMADRGVETAKKLGKDTLLQHAGTAHIFGWGEEGDLPYETSLCATYRKAGAAVLPVLLTNRTNNFGLNELPEAAYQELANSVVIDGLAENTFHVGEEEKETKFIEQIHEKSGDNLGFYDVANNKEHYVQQAYDDVDEIIEQYNNSIEP